MRQQTRRRQTAPLLALLAFSNVIPLTAQLDSICHDVQERKEKISLSLFSGNPASPAGALGHSLFNGSRGGPTTGPTGGSMTGPLSGSMTGPLGGSMAPLGGPLGGSMAASLGRPMAGSLGGPMAGRPMPPFMGGPPMGMRPPHPLGPGPMTPVAVSSGKHHREYTSEVPRQVAEGVSYCLKHMPLLNETARKVRMNKVFCETAAAVTRTLGESLESLRRRSTHYLIPQRAATAFATHVAGLMSRNVAVSETWQRHLDQIQDLSTRNYLNHFFVGQLKGGFNAMPSVSKTEVEKTASLFSGFLVGNEEPEAQEFEREAKQLKSAVDSEVRDFVRVHDYVVDELDEGQIAAEILGVHHTWTDDEVVRSLFDQYKSSTDLAAGLYGVLRATYGTLSELTPSDELESKGIPESMQRYMISVLCNTVTSSMDDQQKHILNVTGNEVSVPSSLNYRWLRLCMNAGVWHYFEGKQHVAVDDVKKVNWMEYLQRSPALKTAWQWASDADQEQQYVFNTSMNALLLVDQKEVKAKRNTSEWTEDGIALEDNKNEDQSLEN